MRTSVYHTISVAAASVSSILPLEFSSDKLASSILWSWSRSWCRFRISTIKYIINVHRNLITNLIFSVRACFWFRGTIFYFVILIFITVIIIRTSKTDLMKKSIIFRRNRICSHQSFFHVLNISLKNY